MVLKNNKKAFSEITSFALITLLIIISSIMAYLFSNDMLNHSIVELDSKNMKTNFKKINYELSQITQFDGASFSINMAFNEGLLVFIDDSLIYESLLEYSGGEFCEDDICYSSSGGYEEIYFDLSDNYAFAQNVTLRPESYILRFKNNKNEKKIDIYLE